MKHQVVEAWLSRDGNQQETSQVKNKDNDLGKKK